MSYRIEFKAKARSCRHTSNIKEIMRTTTQNCRKRQQTENSAITLILLLLCSPNHLSSAFSNKASSLISSPLSRNRRYRQSSSLNQPKVFQLHDSNSLKADISTRHRKRSYKKHKDNDNPPPKAPAFPLVGTLPLIGLEKAVGLGPPPHIQMAQLAKRYGPVMQLDMGRQTWIVLSSPQAVHNAFVENGADFSGRPMVPSMRISAGGAKAGFSVATLTPRLRQLRKTATVRLFDAAQVERAQQQLHDEAQRLANHLLDQSRKYGRVQLRPALRRAVANCVLLYTFSERVPYASEKEGPSSSVMLFEELTRSVDHIWTELTSTETTTLDLVAPEAITSSPQAYPRLRRLVQQRDAILKQLVSQRRKERAMRSKRAGGHINDTTIASATEQEMGVDMLDSLLDAGLPDADIHYTLVDMFVAGVNTVSTQLEWFLLLLANDTKEQTFARNSIGHDGRQDYLPHVMKEVLRMKPPLLLPRMAVTDSTILGYNISKDSIVFANSWALCHDNQLWKGQDVHRFRPDRWYYEEEELKHGGTAACKFLPYSIGKRVCPGSRLSDAQLSIFSQVLLERLQWRKADRGPVDLSEDFSLTLVPKVCQSLQFFSVYG